ncbi:tRNA1(Val) (adenine(37)-N6)-methyltransferase [Roseivivax lentus]|uniref:tRNA1(Val) (adenine(37)-N6)-methyltransferase n=1 Tax=Roseivivax lentus TaxID=633194 RepID=UPI001F2F06F6|nr:methyltransferase [Roseivivax lentus]
MRDEAGQFAAEALSVDAYLGGRLRLAQPLRGYRAGIDPVLLAAAVPAMAGQRVLDLGCGAGAALFCLATRIPGLLLTGVERQADYAALAMRNAEENGLAARIATADLAALPADLRQERFDHILANPPYWQAEARDAAQDPGREAALCEVTPLATWIKVAARRLAPAGQLHMVHRAERLPDILTALHGRLGSIELKPLAPRTGRAARLILVRARKGGRAGFRLHAPLILHDGAQHVADGEDYTPAVRAMLRDAAPLDFEACA